MIHETVIRHAHIEELSKEEIETLLRMCEHDGWEIYKAVIQEKIMEMRENAAYDDKEKSVGAMLAYEGAIVEVIEHAKFTLEKMREEEKAKENYTTK